MKGVAHVGVLQALLERGHRRTRIIGSSVGALIGAAWAGGMGIAKLREIALSLKRKEVFAVAHADMAFKRMRSPALFRREPLEHLIARTCGDLTFQQLDPPVVVNTVDLNSGMQVFWGLPGLDDIRVADAVFASCALPGYFPPHEISGRFYVDGAARPRRRVAGPGGCRHLPQARGAGARGARALHGLRPLSGPWAAGDVGARRGAKGGRDAPRSGVVAVGRRLHPPLPDVCDYRATGGSGGRYASSVWMRS